MKVVDDTHTGITCDPAVMLGKPCVAGTRLTVEFILEQLAGRLSVDELLEGFPHLTPDGVRAALRFAAASVRNDVFFPLFVNQPEQLPA
jgi:uncharacterized protein (DUF433 family)